jgi:hypothetical protein
MTESRPDSPLSPVHLQVEALPYDVAEQIRELQSEDPELLRRILLYGVTHRVVFETLSRSWPS